MRSYQYPYMSNFDDYMYQDMAYASTTNPCGAGRRCLNWVARGTKCGQCSGQTPAPVGGGGESFADKPLFFKFGDIVTGKHADIPATSSPEKSVIQDIIEGNPQKTIADIDRETRGEAPEFISTMFKKPGKSPFDFSNFNWSELTTNPALYMPIIVGVGAFFLFIMLVK